jgi:predicted MFS family arabinose efflux permease
MIEQTPQTDPPPLRRNRDFQLLWLGSIVSVLGSRISSIAYPLLVLALTGSAVDAGLVGFTATIPYILIQLPAGALVDRWNRKRVMIVCDAGRALALGSIVLAVAFDSISLIQLMIVSFLEGSLYVFHSLAEPAAVRNLVHPRHLPLAISQIEARERGASLVGQPIGGFLFDLGHAVPFLADTLSYVVSLGTMLSIKGPLQGDRTGERRALLSEISSAIGWLWRQPFLRATTILVAGSNLLFEALSLFVIVIAREQGASSTAIGALLAGFGVGGLLGTLVAPTLQRRLSLRTIVIGANWVWALALPWIGIVSNLWVLGAILGAMAFVGPAWNVAIHGYGLLITPDQMQGRVESAIGFLSYGAMPLGALLAGCLLGYFSSGVAIIVLSGSMLVLALAATMTPAIRQARSTAATTEAGPA